MSAHRCTSGSVRSASRDAERRHDSVLHVAPVAVHRRRLLRPSGALADGARLDGREHSSAASRTVAETDKIEDPLQRWQERRGLTAALNAEQADQARAADRGGVVAVDAGGTLTDLDVFAQAVADLVSAGAEPSAVYLAPATWRWLSQLKKSADSNEPLVSAELSATGRPARAILGVPVFLSATMPAAQAVVAQASEIVVVRRSDLQVDVGEHFRFSRARCVVRVNFRAQTFLAAPAGVAVIDNLPTT